VSKTYTVDGLAQSISELVDLLRLYGDAHWSGWLAADLPRIRQGDIYGLEHLLRAFGGMGSLNDLVLCERNGYDVRPEDERAVNDRFRDLLGTVYRSATALRGRESGR